MSGAAVTMRPAFPPLLTGLPCAPNTDPFEVAQTMAQDPDFEPGTVVFAEDDGRFACALILAPDRPLADAAPALLAVALGLSDALGAIAPPEVACQFNWPDRVLINGARAGGFRMAASTTDAQAEPDWLVIAADLAIASRASEGGADPDRTALHDEGCGEVTVPALIEAYAHHLMNWLHVFLTDGLQELHEDYTGKLVGLGDEVDYPRAGRFVGLDERAGMIFRDDAGTTVIPLTTLIQE